MGPLFDEARAAFVSEVTAAFRRHGETGALKFDEPDFTLLLVGPPCRKRRLGHLFGQWLRASVPERLTLVDEFGRKRFGNDIITSRSDLVTDADTDQQAVHCCGDEDLVLLRCPACAFIWILCYECETWHLEPAEGAGRQVAANGTGCPNCGHDLPDRIEEMLPTRRDVVGAGLERFLAR